MIPVRVGLIDPNDETMRKAAALLLPEDILRKNGGMLIGAMTQEGLLAGALAAETVEDNGEGGLLRLLWLEVLPDLRRNGIATVLTDFFLASLSADGDLPSLTAWYTEEEAEDGFGAFLENTGLFDISEEEVNGKDIRIALWNGETFESLEADEESDIP